MQQMVRVTADGGEVCFVYILVVTYYIVTTVAVRFATYSKIIDGIKSINDFSEKLTFFKMIGIFGSHILSMVFCLGGCHCRDFCIFPSFKLASF